MEFTIPATNGVNLIPFSSRAMNRTVSFKYHTMPTGGSIEVKARPIGRTEFISIDDAPPFSAESEKTIAIGYPVGEIEVIITGIVGGTVIYVTISDGE